MNPFELEARESIRDLVARYNASGDSGRFDAMLALFAEDATLELEGGVQRGKPAIRALFEGVARLTGGGVGRAPASSPLHRHAPDRRALGARGARPLLLRRPHRARPRPLGPLRGRVPPQREPLAVRAPHDHVDAAVPGGWAGQALPPQETP
jgi:hypothetical protein